MRETLKRILINLIVLFVNTFNLRKNIVLEIEPGREDNTEILFKEMLSEGWNEKYKIVVVTGKPDEFSEAYKNVTVIKRASLASSGIWKLIDYYCELAKALIIIDCNVQLKKENRKTIHVFLDHGSPIKSTKEYYNCSSDTDYMTIQAEFWRPFASEQLGIHEDKLVCTGLPRNDKLLTYNEGIGRLFNEKYKKIVVMYPTYRQHNLGNYHDGIAIPIIHNEKTALQINEIAEKYGVLLIVKPHPAQHLGNIKEICLSNIKFLYNDFFIKNGISSYEFLAGTDALITDYSSVFSDYIITGKPIGLTFEDIEEYKKSPGIAIDTEIMTCCSEMLYTPEDFELFFRDLVSGVDLHKEKRKKVMHIMDDFCDSGSTERVAYWIADLIGYKQPAKPK